MVSARTGAGIDQLLVAMGGGWWDANQKEQDTPRLVKAFPKG